MPINKDKLAKRTEVKEHNPDFVRPESWRYKRLETNMEETKRCRPPSEKTEKSW